MLKSFILAASTAAASLIAAPAVAGSANPPAPEPSITQAVPFTPSGPDWTGFYVGGQAGYADVDGNLPALSGDGFIGGLTAGYDYDFGQFVLGAGLDYDFTDISILAGPPATDQESIWRLKLRGGAKIGNGLLYATGGYAQADTNTLGSEDGYFIGAGYEHLISDQWSVGGEVLYHEFDNYGGTATDVDATTVQVRATFRF